MKDIIERVDDFLAPLFGRLPPLPGDIRSSLVLYLPWLGAAVGVLGILGFLGVMRAPVAGIISLGLGVLGILARRPLGNRERRGWDYLWGVCFLAAFYGLATLSPAGVLAALGGLYLLYQVKGEYTGGEEVGEVRGR